MNNKELAEQLTALSAKVKMTVTELSEIAETIAQAEYDPLPPYKWSEVFEYWHRVAIFERDDFCLLCDPVPPADAQISLRRAFRNYRTDLENSAYALKRDLSMNQACLVFRNGWDWARFWAVRYPVPEGRAAFERCLAEYEVAAARLLARARRLRQ